MTEQLKTTGTKNEYYCDVIRRVIINELDVYFEQYSTRASGYTSVVKSKRYWMSFSAINSKVVKVLIGKVDQKSIQKKNDTR